MTSDSEGTWAHGLDVETREVDFFIFLDGSCHHKGHCGYECLCGCTICDTCDEEVPEFIRTIGRLLGVTPNTHCESDEAIRERKRRLDASLEEAE